MYNDNQTEEVIPGFYYWNGSDWIRIKVGDEGEDADWYDQDGNAPMTISQTIYTEGMVGIGTATPFNTLDIATETRTGNPGSHASGRPLYITGDISATSNGVEVKLSDATQGVGIGYAGIYAAGANTYQDLSFLSKGTGDLIFNTNATERMQIDGATGNVGIGTETPAAKLDVVSTNSGILIPRIALDALTDQDLDNDAINESFTKGEMIFNTGTGSLTTVGFYYWDGVSVWVSVTPSAYNILSDDDGDTYIDVEATADEDKIRFYLGNNLNASTNHFVMDGPRLEVLNSGRS
ncbi:MAG: hypothetical protein GY751_08445, partial [Bacteroidetes bacterium]|nr:hypothetical protein [Bacteroidota bacterium]